MILSKAALPPTAPQISRFMPSFRQIKRFLRSGNFRYSLDTGAKGEINQLSWKEFTVRYRSKSCDVAHVERLLLLGKRCEYHLPPALAPEYILDGGANIGLASLYFKHHFPSANIACFEPSAANLPLLNENVSGVQGITVFHGAWGVGGRGRISNPDRAFSSFRIEEEEGGEFPIHTLAEVIQMSHFPRIDLLKIDIEGSEWAFFDGATEKELGQISWIVGEVHGDNEWRLLDKLSGQFEIDIRKTMGRRYSKFHACNRGLVEKLMKDFDRRILQY